MPPPLVQEIRSVFQNEGLQEHIRMLRELRAAEQELNRQQKAVEQQDRQRTAQTRRSSSEQQKAMRLIKQVVKEARAEFALLNEASRKGELSAENFDRAVQKLSANAERNLQRIRGSMGRVGSGAALEFKQAEVALARFSTRTKIEATGMSRLRTRIGAGVGDALSQRTGGVYDQLGLVTRALSVVRGGFQATFGGVAVYAVSRAAVALERFTQHARQFQRQMAEIGTMGDASAAAMGRLEKGVIDIAARVGGGTITEFAKALYDIRSSGFDGAEALEILEASARSAVGGVTDVATASDLVTSALNAYKLPASEAARVTDLLFQAVRAGKTTIPQLAGAIGQVAPVAAAANVSLEELLAGVATLTASGLSTNESVTRMRAVISSIVDPADQAAAAANAMGVEFGAEALQAKGLSGVLADVERATGGNVEAMAQLFSETEALEGAIQLAGRQADTFRTNLDGMRQSTGSATEAYEEMRATTDLLTQTLANRYEATLIRLSSKVLPAYNAALRNVLYLTDQLRDPTERLIGVLKELEGIDPAVIARLELQVSDRDLRRQQQDLEEQLRGRSFRFTTERQRESVLTGPVIDPMGWRTGRSTRMNAEDMTDRQLEEIRQRIAHSLERLGSAIEEGVSGARVQSLTNEYNRQLEDLNEVIRLRTELSAVNQALARTESDLAQKTAPIPVPRTTGGLFDQGALFSNMFERGPGQDAASTRSVAERIQALEQERDKLVAAGVATERLAVLNREITQLKEKQQRLQSYGVPENQKQEQERLERAKESAQELLKAYADAAELAASDESVKTQLEDIHRLNKEILGLERQIAEVRGQPEAASLQEILKTKEAERERAQAWMRQRKEMLAFLEEGENAFTGLKPLTIDIEADTAVYLADQVNRITDQVRADVEGVKIDLGFDDLTPEEAEKRIQALTEKAKERLREIYEAFKHLLPPEARAKIEAFLSGMDRPLSEAAKDAARAAEAFKELTGHVRGMYRLAEALGVVSDEMKAVAEGALDAMDGLSQLQEFEAQKAKGEKVSKLAEGTAALGLVAGFIGAFTGWAQAAQQRHAEEKQAHRELIQRLLDLQRAMKEYAKAMADARKSLLGGGTVGAGRTQAEIDAARGITADMDEMFRTGGTPGRGGPRGGTGRGRVYSEAEQVQFRSWLQDLQQTGLFDFDLEEYFNKMLEQNGGNWQLAMETLLRGGRGSSHDGILSIIEDVGASFGELSKDIDGASQAFDDAQRFFGKSAAEALNDWSRFLLENVDGLSDEARTKLDRVKEISADGVISDEERAELEAMAAWFLANGLGSQFTPEAGREIAETILAGLPDQAEEAEGEMTRSIQIMRSINEIQANELVAQGDEGIRQRDRVIQLLASSVTLATHILQAINRIAQPVVKRPGGYEVTGLNSAAIDRQMALLQSALSRVTAPRPAAPIQMASGGTTVDVGGIIVNLSGGDGRLTEAQIQQVLTEVGRVLRDRASNPFNPLGRR